MYARNGALFNLYSTAQGETLSPARLPRLGAKTWTRRILYGILIAARLGPCSRHVTMQWLMLQQESPRICDYTTAKRGVRRLLLSAQEPGWGPRNGKAKVRSGSPWWYWCCSCVHWSPPFRPGEEADTPLGDLIVVSWIRIQSKNVKEMSERFGKRIRRHCSGVKA